MWQSWQTMPALPCGPSFHSSCVAFTKTPHGFCSLWQVPQNSAVLRNGFSRVTWYGLSAASRFPCFVRPGSEIQLKLTEGSPARPVMVWQRSQETPSLAREPEAGRFGGTSPARKATGAWQPLQPAFTPETFATFSACGTASSKYSISSHGCVKDWDIIACSCWRAMSTWQLAHACGRS
jgi:hypothetical protein